MAAACDASEGTETEASVNAIISYNEDLSDTRIVAQAITELQEIGPGDGSMQQTQYASTTSVGQHIINSQTEIIHNIEDLGEITTLPDGTSTQVIYFIKEDGQVEEQRFEERILVDSSVQANDYDIERRFSRLPARKRIIPAKFRDYRDASDRSGSDDDYIPDNRPKVKVRKIIVDIDGEIVKRPVGRPRKHPVKSGTLQQSDGQYTDTQPPFTEPAQGNQSIGNEQDAGTQSVDGGCGVDEAREPAPREDAQKAETETKIPTLDEPYTKPKEEPQSHGDEEWNPMKLPTESPVKRRPGRPRGPHWDQSYRCPECSKSFTQKGNLKVHMRIHGNEKPFPCQEPGCTKAFRSNESLRKHTLSHRGIKPFDCHICGNKFSSSVGLQEHISRHSDTKPYTCRHCDRRFRQVSCLRRHIITHGTETPYTCEVCSKQFSQPQYLRSHTRVHTGEKPFSCDLCDKKFAYQSDVKRHKITHTGDKPFACEICGARFSDSSSRRRHEREHVSRKPYLCQLCNETFKRSGQLKAHLSRRHIDNRIVNGITLKGNVGDGEVVIYGVADDDTEQVPGVPQQRIVQLIKSLQNKTFVENVEIESSIVNNAEKESIAEKFTIFRDHVVKETDHVMEVEPVVMETGAVPLDFQNAEITENVNGQTYIALTDIAESLLLDKAKFDGTTHYQYQVIQEVSESGEQQQILIQIPEDIQTNVGEVTQVEEITENVDAVMEAIAAVPHENFTATTTTMEGNTEQTTACGEPPTVEDKTDTIVTADGDKDTSAAASMHYVNNPDFTSQAYYNWLSNFTELCKVVPMPLDVSLFQKISQVHKTLSDVMATPSGVVADKENFRVLMNISKELSMIINEHLLYVLENQI